MVVRHDRLQHLMTTAGWIGALVPLATVLLSIQLSPVTNWTVRATVAGFSVLAVLRPDAALLVTIAFVGFGVILSHLGGVPGLRVTEVLVAASLLGCCVRALLNSATLRGALSGPISVPVVLFALAAIASTIVWQQVYPFLPGYPSTYTDAFLQFVTRDYYVKPGDFWVLVSTAVVLEGLLLYLVVMALCRADATFFDRALRMLVVGGSGLAIMSIVRLAEILLRSPGAIPALQATTSGLRISPQIPDYIAAGSYFALCWLAGLGITVASAGNRLIWVVLGMPAMAALYLTGSRSGIVAAFVGLVVLGAIVARRRTAAARGVLVFAVVAVAAMFLSYRSMIGRDVAGELAKRSVAIRFELLRTGLGVMATRPLLGVGIDRFYLVARRHATPEILAMWRGRLSPHNDFLRIGAELGLVGLGLFLWILVSAGRRMWVALRQTRDARLAGLAGGLGAFLVTSVASNPLVVRDVSYVFWIALGLAVGYSARLQSVTQSVGAAINDVQPAVQSRVEALIET